MTERETALYSKAQTAAYEASQPFVRVAVDLIAISPVTLTIFKDKIVSVRYPDDVEAKLAELREMAREEAQRAADVVLLEQGMAALGAGRNP